MTGADSEPASNRSSDYRERDCPLCGSDTEVIGLGNKERVCTSSDCLWGVSISSSRTKSDSERIEELEDRVERLEQLLEENCSD